MARILINCCCLYMCHISLSVESERKNLNFCPCLTLAQLLPNRPIVSAPWVVAAGFYTNLFLKFLLFLPEFAACQSSYGVLYVCNKTYVPPQLILHDNSNSHNCGSLGESYNNNIHFKVGE